MIQLLLWTAAIIAFLVYFIVSCPNVVALILEVPTMAKKRRKPLLVFSPSVTRYPSGTIEASIEVRKTDGTLVECRMWRFRRDDAESVLWDMENFEPHDNPLLSETALECLVGDVRRVLRRTEPISLEQRLQIKVA